MGVKSPVNTSKIGVEIGRIVKVKLDWGPALSLKIGGHNEGNPDQGVISCDAPLAKAILGKKQGETTDYRVGERVISVKILEVRR